MNAKIIVDGEELGLNDFAERVVFGINSGKLDQMRDTEGWKSVQITLSR